MEQALNDCADDLVRVSSEIAPHDKGILEKSHAKEVKVVGVKAEAIVSYTVRERNSKGNFNYALYMHEGVYDLGEGSRRKPGTSGMSGKHYDVGSKYLTRPLEGEKEAYKKHIEEKVHKAIT
ncbi:MAG: hypothetical protein WC601_06710 [Desulfotomaculaceae bacterium]